MRIVLAIDLDPVATDLLTRAFTNSAKDFPETLRNELDQLLVTWALDVLIPGEPAGDIVVTILETNE